MKFTFPSSVKVAVPKVFPLSSVIVAFCPSVTSCPSIFVMLRLSLFASVSFAKTSTVIELSSSVLLLKAVFVKPTLSTFNWTPLSLFISIFNG